MLRSGCAAAALLLWPRWTAAAPTLWPPPAGPGRGVAVVVDAATYQAAREELQAYQRSLGRRGYAGWLLVDQWARPEAVRAALEQLRARPGVRLEGLFLVGEIPIVMARDAQHLTSAFKMDQERYPPLRSSVPTDRFYDDRDLRWEFLEADPADPLRFYYRLAPSSPVHLRKDLYSGRLTPRGGTAVERQAAVRRYFAKLAAVTRRSEVLDRVVLAMGHGYVSESSAALTAHAQELRDMLGYGAAAQLRVDTIAQLYDNAVKPRLLQSLADPAVDLAVIHSHGDSAALLLDTAPLPATSAAERESGQAAAEVPAAPKPWHLASSEVARLPLRAEVALLDACFTGSFADPDYLAAALLTGPGDTVAVFANSRNVRQDIWSQEPLALLRAGLSVGQAQQRVRFLEAHLFGDPTYAFRPLRPARSVVEAYRSTDPRRLLALRQAADPVARGLAYERLGRAADPRPGLGDPAPLVRLKALRELVALRPADLTRRLVALTSDGDAQVRKFATILLGDQGDPRAAADLTRLAIFDPCSRCRWQAAQALGFLGSRFESAVSAQAAQLWTELGYPERSTLLADQASRYLAAPPAEWAVQHLADADPARRRLGVRPLRGNRYREALPRLLDVLKADRDQTVRANAAEALGWWSLDQQRPEIASALAAAARDGGSPPMVRTAADLALRRLQAGPNEPLVP
ncbi:MAG: HEAT repeat domain-containing protein [Fimbriimonadaceae bacterium]|nr:HEAT repeat domain-containing protein [Fimbriimonadaceae bacterium]